MISRYLRDLLLDLLQLLRALLSRRLRLLDRVQLPAVLDPDAEAERHAPQSAQQLHGFDRSQTAV